MIQDLRRRERYNLFYNAVSYSYCPSSEARVGYYCHAPLPHPPRGCSIFLNTSTHQRGARTGAIRQPGTPLDKWVSRNHLSTPAVFGWTITISRSARTNNWRPRRPSASLVDPRKTDVERLPGEVPALFQEVEAYRIIMPPPLPERLPALLGTARGEEPEQQPARSRREVLSSFFILIAGRSLWETILEGCCLIPGGHRTPVREHPVPGPRRPFFMTFSFGPSVTRHLWGILLELLQSFARTVQAVRTLVLGTGCFPFPGPLSRLLTLILPRDHTW